MIEACVDEFLRTPAEIHLAPDALLDRFTEAKVEQVGPVAGLSLTRSPLSALQRAEKRLFDLFVSSLGSSRSAPFLAHSRLPCVSKVWPGAVSADALRFQSGALPHFQVSLHADDGRWR